MPKSHVCKSCIWHAEKPEEVWTEVSDGSCRWRQSASEVKVMCLLVPPGLPAKHLQVDFKPYHIQGGAATCTLCCLLNVLDKPALKSQGQTCTDAVTRTHVQNMSQTVLCCHAMRCQAVEHCCITRPCHHCTSWRNRLVMHPGELSHVCS